jgi:hypothetical protein
MKRVEFASHVMKTEKYLLSCNMVLLISGSLKFGMYICYGYAYSFCMIYRLKIKKL